ncbi:MAG TPA: succinoglycan biosynthesis protein exov [Rheinheimera sp.]|uniref:polysaccharide pyruvyl transferase family protein n=1 Tax=Rheinheimera sp. TaxID=1869214 RepID=UPI000EE8740B|nr:polysaccharide pyruvyl transferase family protein [Rheinheimera sp.]HCU65320.1 succinoglycan biosynthesis protein exov [Rheinheimera sp.]
MKLYYFKDPHGNFGDDLNPWLFGQLFPELLDDNEQDLLVGVGTLLNHRIPTANKVTVFGSGHGYGQLPAINDNWTFSCVRGPRTAKALGLSAETAITDAAMLTPLFFNESLEKRYQTSYMPHCHSALLGDWQYLCTQAGVHFIDPRQPFLQVFKEIKQSKHLITEAMHGAILADAFRVPWTPAKAYPHISEFKWQDWLDSVAVTAEFNFLPAVYRGDELFGLKDTFKHKIKRLLYKTPLWQHHWQEAPIARSSQQVVDSCASALQQLAAKQQMFLSADQLLQHNTERLLAKATALRSRHAG